MDSNHRSRKTADLQSAPFGHSGIRPFYLSHCAQQRKRDLALLLKNQREKHLHPLLLPEELSVRNGCKFRDKF